MRVPADGWSAQLASASVPTALRGDADTLPELAWAEADTQVDAEGLIEDYRFAQGEESLREDRRLHVRLRHPGPAAPAADLRRLARRAGHCTTPLPLSGRDP